MTSPIAASATIRSIVSEQLAGPRLNALLATGFGLAALALAALGLGAALAEMVSRRRAELGVRLALGSILASVAEPAIAILDDPLTHCDVGRLNKMRSILRSAAEGDPMRTSPPSCGCRPANTFNKVDLPQPDGPTKATSSPGMTSKVAQDMARCSLLPVR